MEITKVKFIENKPLKNKFIVPIDYNKYGFKLFTNAAFIGGMGSGKTTTLINFGNYLIIN